MGVVTLKRMVDFRPYFIVSAFVVAAIVTPPDVISQLMLAIPLCLLYQLGLYMAKWVTPREKLAEQEAQAAADAD